MTDARPSPPPRPVAVHLVAIAVAVAGLLQLIASVALGLAAPHALHRAAREGPRVYILATLVLAACMLVAWLLRRRRLAAAALSTPAAPPPSRRWCCSCAHRPSRSALPRSPLPSLSIAATAPARSAGSG